MNRQDIVKSISSAFPTRWYNATKFGMNQILMAIALASVSRFEHVKGHVIAGSTLTDNFWANDILWQLNVLAYNLSVMMRQKKSKFKQQEHRTFIDWFIAVPAKITSSGHQIELKMYEHHFYKADWEELDRLIEAA